MTKVEPRRSAGPGRAQSPSAFVMYNLCSLAVVLLSLCLGLGAAHQYYRGSYPHPPSGWPSYRPQQGATPGHPGSWGTSHWPVTNGGMHFRPTTAPSTPPADRLGTAETIYPYPPPGQPPVQNSVLSSGGCQVGAKMYKVGDKWTPEGGCGRVSCMQGGKTTTLGCPQAEPNDRCALADPDPRQPWPLCCPQVRC